MKIKYYSNVILLGLSVCSQAAPIESLKEKEQLLICQKERDTGRFQEAVDCYLPLAEKENNIIAQTFLAHIYEHQKEYRLAFDSHGLHDVKFIHVGSLDGIAVKIPTKEINGRLIHIKWNECPD